MQDYDAAREQTIISDAAMMDEPHGFRFGELEVDVNWNPASTPCKAIRFRMGEKEVTIPRSDFYAMLVLFSGPKELDLLIPVKETEVRMITRLLQIRVKNDIRKGGLISVPYTYPVDAQTYNKLIVHPSGKYRPANLSTGKSLQGIVNKSH